MRFKQTTKFSFNIISVLTIEAAVLLLFSFVFCFDAENGYFTDGFWSAAFIAIYAIGILGSLLSAFLINRNLVIRSNDSCDEKKAPFVIIGAALAVCGVVFDLFSKAFDFYSLLGTLGVTAFAVYIILLATKGGYSFSTVKLFALLFSIPFPLYIVVNNNSNYSYHVNSVQNMLSAIFSISFLLYVLYEGKRLYNGSHSRWHIASMLLTHLSGLSLSTAYILACICGITDEEFRFCQMILVLLISIFVRLELQGLIRSAEARTQEEWDELEPAASEAVDVACDEEHTDDIHSEEHTDDVCGEEPTDDNDACGEEPADDNDACSEEPADDNDACSEEPADDAHS